MHCLWPCVGQTPSGRWGKSCHERRRGVRQSPQSPEAGTRLLVASPRADGIDLRSQERRFWPGTGNGGAESRDPGSGRRPGVSSPAPTAPALPSPPGVRKAWDFRPARRLAPPPLPALRLRPDSRPTSPRPPGKPSPSGLTDTSSVQSKVAVPPRAPLGSAFASSGPGSRGRGCGPWARRCPLGRWRDSALRAARVVPSVYAKSCLCAFRSNLQFEEKFTGSYLETSERPGPFPQFPQRQHLAHLVRSHPGNGKGAIRELVALSTVC